MSKKDKKAYYQAYQKAHREERNARAKAWYKAHKEEVKAYHRVYKKQNKEKIRSYSKADINSLGKPKDYIRNRSNRYLFNILKHPKLKGYEIHHCFGYVNYKCFIYIPKVLHLQIHQYLRDNNISAESNHYAKIAHLINEWNGYTYIKV